MKLALTIVYIVIALLLTVIVLFQKGKDTKSSAVMGGSGDTFFAKNKSNTREALLEKLTAVFAVLFILYLLISTLSVMHISNRNSFVFYILFFLLLKIYHLHMLYM